MVNWQNRNELCCLLLRVMENLELSIRKHCLKYDWIPRRQYIEDSWECQQSMYSLHAEVLERKWGFLSNLRKYRDTCHRHRMCIVQGHKLCSWVVRNRSNKEEQKVQTR